MSDSTGNNLLPKKYIPLILLTFNLLYGCEDRKLEEEESAKLKEEQRMLKKMAIYQSIPAIVLIENLLIVKFQQASY